MIVYKCVSESLEGKFTSRVARGESQVEYKVGEWAEAHPPFAERGYHLLVFETKDGALGFDPRSVWKAEAEDEVGLPFKLPERYIRKGIFLDEPTYQVWPHGTRMFKRVKLLEKVDP